MGQLRQLLGDDAVGRSPRPTGLLIYGERRCSVDGIINLGRGEDSGDGGESIHDQHCCFE